MAKWLRKWRRGWLYVRSNTKNAKSLSIGRMRTPVREAFSYGIRHGIRHIHCDSMKYDLMLHWITMNAVCSAVSRMKMPPVREYASSLVHNICDFASFFVLLIIRPCFGLLSYVPTPNTYSNWAYLYILTSFWNKVCVDQFTLRDIFRHIFHKYYKPSLKKTYRCVDIILNTISPYHVPIFVKCNMKKDNMKLQSISIFQTDVRWHNFKTQFFVNKLRSLSHYV